MMFPAGAGVHQVGGAHPTAVAPASISSMTSSAVHDAAHAHDGNVHGLVDLIHHPHRQREDAGAGHAAGAVGQQRTAALQIDPHARQGVDEADTVGAGVLAGPGNVGDVR